MALGGYMSEDMDTYFCNPFKRGALQRGILMEDKKGIQKQPNHVNLYLDEAVLNLEGFATFELFSAYSHISTTR